MDARERRRAIMGVLERAKDPVSGSALAREVGVSRQIVVQDIALLRADRAQLLASMTDEVARLVLLDNYRQNQAISLMERMSVNYLFLRRQQ